MFEFMRPGKASNAAFATSRLASWAWREEARSENEKGMSTFKAKSQEIMHGIWMLADSGAVSVRSRTQAISSRG